MSFFDIFEEIKTYEKYITNLIDGNEFFKYVSYIDEHISFFKAGKLIASF